MGDKHEDNMIKIPMEVLLPSEEEKNRAVMWILDTAMPQKNNVWQELYRTANAVGVRTLFFGVGDCFFLAFLAVLLLCVCLFPAAAVMVKMVRMVPFLFLLSPAFYALAHLLTMWREYQTRTLEWKQTWRISFRTVMALRMLVLGAISVVGSILICAVLWSLSRQMVSFVWMLSVAFSALFLYGGSSLFCQRLWGMRVVVAVPVGWITVSLVPVLWEPASIWMMQIPVYVFLLISAAAGAFYIAQMYYFVAAREL